MKKVFLKSKLIKSPTLDKLYESAQPILHSAAEAFARNADVEASPYRNLKNLDTVIGPDGITYDINKIMISLAECGSAISKAYPDLTYFYNVIADNLVITFEVPTMATDSLRLFVNPAFYMELMAKCGSAGVIFVLIHEIYHNLFTHVPRMKMAGLDNTPPQMKANVAADLEINWWISQLDEDFMAAIKTIGACFDEKYAGMTMEDIYAELDNKSMQDPNKDKEDKDEELVKLDPGFKSGYSEGWNKAIEEAIQQGLLMPTEPRKSSNNNIVSAIVESAGSSQDPQYQEGYNTGYQACWEMIKRLQMSGKGGGGGGMTPPNDPNQPEYEQIDGLRPIKPNFPVNNNGGQNSNKKQKSDNTPVEVSSQDQQQNQQNNQNGDGGGEGQQSQQQSNWDKTGSKDGRATGLDQKDNIYQNRNQNGQGQSGQSDSQNGQQGQGQNGEGTDSQNDPNGQSGQQSGQNGQGSNQNNQNGSTTNGGGSNGNGQFNQNQNGQNGQNSQGQSGNQQGSDQNGQNGAGADGSQQGQNSSIDYNSIAKKVKHVSNGFGKGQGFYKGGQQVSSGSRDQSAYGDMISKAEGDRIERKDGTVREFKHNQSISESSLDEKLKRQLDSKEMEAWKSTLRKMPPAGKSHADFLGKVANLFEPPKLDWKRLLKRYLIHAYTEVIDKFPKKKWVDQGRFKKYEKKAGESGKDIIYLIDNSGSMNDDDFKAAIKEINAVVADIKVETAYVAQSDTRIQTDNIMILKPQKRHETIEKLSSIVRSGCGGTDFTDAFDWISNTYIPKKGKPEAVIVITDGIFTLPPKPAKWADKIIWVIITETGNYEFANRLPWKFGKVIFYNG